LRRLYYVPILFAAFTHGSRGGFAVALIASLSYGPHAFLVGPPGHDPETALNKILEIVLYNTVGILAGVLADREARRRAQVERAYEEQRRMSEQLVRAGRLAALGELVAGIAHELKNPLHTIKGTAEIVDEVVPQDVEQSSMWTLHRQEIERLERIAERFLSFARPSRVQLVPVRLADLHARISELLKARVQSAPDIRLEVGAVETDMTESTVRVDRDQLAQAVLSIAGNAIRAMQDHGELHLSIDSQEDTDPPTAAIRLENDGPAIPEEDLERIFDPFFTRAEQGTGLGLPIAERIVEAHGGFIRVENKSTKRGVVFTVVLPIVFYDHVMKEEHEG
jgi:signal transduction histidine kinase